MTTAARAGERGSVTVWIVVMAMPLMIVAGLVFDGGRILAERREALDVAQNAARAGAQAVDVSAVRSGDLRLDPQLVQLAAQDYLTATGHTGAVSIDGASVTVTVTNTVDMQLLSAIGIGEKTVTGTSTARLVRGVEGADE